MFQRTQSVLETTNSMAVATVYLPVLLKLDSRERYLTLVHKLQLYFVIYKKSIVYIDIYIYVYFFYWCAYHTHARTNVTQEYCKT